MREVRNVCLKLWDCSETWQRGPQACVKLSTEGMRSEGSQEPRAEPWGLRATDQRAVRGAEQLAPHEPRGESFKNKVVLLEATMKTLKGPFGFGNKRELM